MKSPKQVQLAIANFDTRAPVFADVLEWHGVWCVTPFLEEARGGRSVFASQKFQVTHGPTGCKIPQPFHRLDLVHELARRLGAKFGKFGSGGSFGETKWKQRPRGEELSLFIQQFVDDVTAGRVNP
jgi:hypothetical protein